MTQTPLWTTQDALVEALQRAHDDLDDCAEIARRLQQLLGRTVDEDCRVAPVTAQLLTQSRLDAVRDLVQLLVVATTRE